jgi:AcrR family transcriptional regulator
MNQRQVQRMRTRQTLADHALRLFAEQGFDDTTVEQIVAAAGVSQRTFFLHFATKAAAAFPDHAERVESFRTRLGRGSDHANPLPHLVLTMAGGMNQHTPARRIRYGLLGSVSALQDEDARTDRDYERVIAEFLVDCWGSSPPAHLRAEAIANVTIGVARASLIAWSTHGLDPVASSYGLLRAMLCSPFDLPEEIPATAVLPEPAALTAPKRRSTTPPVDGLGRPEQTAPHAPRP